MVPHTTWVSRKKRSISFWEMSLIRRATQGFSIPRCTKRNTDMYEMPSLSAVSLSV